MIDPPFIWLLLVAALIAGAVIYARSRTGGLTGYFRNGSDPKKVEPAVPESERAVLEALEFNKKILNTSSVGILTFRESGPCTFANQAAAGIAGAAVDGLLEQNFHQIHTWQVNGLYRVALAALETGQEQQLEIQARIPSGRETWTNFCLSSFYVRDEKQLLVFMQDITARKLAEQALWASEEKYRRLVETALEGIAFVDTQRRVTYLNSRMEQITGYPAESLLGQVITDFIFAEDIPEQEEQLRRLEQGYNQFYERKIRHADGHGVWLQISATPLLAADGQISGAFAMCSDITERKLAEEALRESEERFRKMAETTSTAILVFQGERFNYLNPACERISGYSQAELLAKKFVELVPPDFREMSLRRSESRQRGEPVPGRLEVEILRKDGARRWVDYSATPITWDGQPAMLGTAFDITERKQAEQALRQANAYNRSLIEASLDPFVTFGPDNKIIDANMAAEQLTGYDRQELIGTYDFELFHRLQ